jgi:hypothetical protein
MGCGAFAFVFSVIDSFYFLLSVLTPRAGAASRVPVGDGAQRLPAWMLPELPRLRNPSPGPGPLHALPGVRRRHGECAGTHHTASEHRPAQLDKEGNRLLHQQRLPMPLNRPRPDLGKAR